MSHAAAAHIDAFELSLDYGDETASSAVATAFRAAQDTGFKLFFTFDYSVGIGPWPRQSLVYYADSYFSNPAYYRHNRSPFVSALGGESAVEDWGFVKRRSGCFFVPKWPLVDPAQAVKLGDGVADGLASWDA